MVVLDKEKTIAFLQKIEKCRGNVWLESDEGDYLNMKSDLTKYVFLSIASEKELIDRCNLRCERKEDEELLKEFLKTNRGSAN